MRTSIDRLAKKLAIAGFLICLLSLVMHNALPGLIGMGLLGMSVVLALVGGHEPRGD